MPWVNRALGISDVTNTITTTARLFNPELLQTNTLLLRSGEIAYPIYVNVQLRNCAAVELRNCSNYQHCRQATREIGFATYL